MPELPDVTLYLEALTQRILGRRLEQIVLVNPFLLRTATPPLSAAEGRQVRALRRVGKRIAFGLDCDLWLADPYLFSGIGNAYSDEMALLDSPNRNGYPLRTRADSRAVT